MIIQKNVNIGKNVTIRENVIIEDNVTIGDNSVIGYRATLKSGTIIGSNSVFDDHCITTGACYIGDNVNVRTGAIISKCTIIKDWSFIGPGVITNHTKHVTHARPNIKNVQLLTIIGYGCIIGSQASLVAGINIFDEVIVGAASVVTKNLDKRGLYLGNPAVYVADITKEYELDFNNIKIKEENYVEIINHIKKFIPGLVV